MLTETDNNNCKTTFTQLFFVRFVFKNNLYSSVYKTFHIILYFEFLSWLTSCQINFHLQIEKWGK